MGKAQPQTKAQRITRANGQQSPYRAILETAKTLTVAYGAREAARQLKLPAGTVLGWARNYNWTKAESITETGQSKGNHEAITPSNGLQTAIESHKSRSQFALGRYVADTAEHAANIKSGARKLNKARQVRDLAAIHSTLWPTDRTTNLLAIGILTGSVSVEDAQ